MSTRSASNPRNNPNVDGPRGGMTRKSAGKAKPARTAAASVRVVPTSAKAKRKAAERGEDLSGLSKDEKRARKAQLRAQEDRVYNATNALMKADPDYAKRRRNFYVILGVGVAIIVLSFVLMALWGNDGKDWQKGLQFATVIAAYVPIIGAFVYDFVRIRPIRNDARTRAEGMSDAKLVQVIERAGK